MNSTMPLIKTELIPPEVGKRVALATIDCMRRIQRDNPALWAKIDARAKELRAMKAKAK